MKFSTKEDRNKYYRSDIWSEIKENLFRIRGKVCEECGNKKWIQVHHLTYDRFGGDEYLTDLKILCRKCHKEIHEMETCPVPVNKLNFYSIPVEVFYNLNISDGCRRLFNIFYLYKNSETGCWASNRYLGGMALLDERSVTRAIGVLEKWGYITVKNKNSTHSRRIFIADYEKKYKDVVDKIYKMRKNVDKFDVLVYNKMFLEARDK